MLTATTALPPPSPPPPRLWRARALNLPAGQTCLPGRAAREICCGPTRRPGAQKTLERPKTHTNHTSAAAVAAKLCRLENNGAQLASRRPGASLLNGAGRSELIQKLAKFELKPARQCGAAKAPLSNRERERERRYGSKLIAAPIASYPNSQSVSQSADLARSLARTQRTGERRFGGNLNFFNFKSHLTLAAAATHLPGEGYK